MEEEAETKAVLFAYIVIQGQSGLHANNKSIASLVDMNPPHPVYISAPFSTCEISFGLLQISEFLSKLQFLKINDQTV